VTRVTLACFVVDPTVAMATCPSPTNRLANQRVLVTGAGRGIGRALALICSREGARVAIAARTWSELEETASLAVDFGGPSDGESLMSLHVADVTNASQVEETVETIVKKWGGIDVLINNAGSSQRTMGHLETLSADDLRSLLDLNVVGVHSVTSAVLRHGMLSSGGRIINISSRAGKVGLPNASHYCASKFALEGMSAALAEEVKDKGIEVNTMSPGMVNTRSFPKPPDRKGVRSAESIEESLFLLLESGVTGHYVHADELDEVLATGLDGKVALKPIRERLFKV